MNYESVKNWISEFGGCLPNGAFKRNHYVKLDDDFYDNATEFLNLCDYKDVYECMYVYENEDFKHCRTMSDLYLDFDADDIENPDVWKRLIYAVKYTLNLIKTTMHIPEDEVQIYYSGSKGFHIVIPAEIIGLVPSTNLNDEFKAFALGVSYRICNKNIDGVKSHGDYIDTGIYDRRRLFRVPNTINSKSGLYKVPVTAEQVRTYSFEQFKEWASEQREVPQKEPKYRALAEEGFKTIIKDGEEYLEKIGQKHKRFHKTIKLQEGERLELLPCAQKLLEAGAVKGQRNHACYALANSIRQCGYTEEETYEMINEWNEEKNSDPIDERELQLTVMSAFKNIENGMTVGCARYKELGVCIDNCKLLE